MKIEIRAVDNGFLFTMSGDVRNRQPRPGCSATDLSAPFAHDYAGIPDQVIAYATALQLTENI
jgi:hypothetical protein